MWTLLSCGHRAGVDGHVPLPQVVVSRPWRAGSTVRGSGLATVATAVVVPIIVAIAMTAVAVLVVVLIPVATVVTVATAGRARRHGGCLPGCRGRNVGVEHR
jgi:hypothetical protein